MKSVTLLSVLLIAAVASASVQIIVDPPAPGTGRPSSILTQTTLVRAVADPGCTITAIMIQFTGPMRQQWDMNYDEETGQFSLPDPPIRNETGPFQTGSGIKDSRFVPLITSSLITNPPPELSTTGTYLEDNLNGSEQPAGLVHVWYGKGTRLGDATGEGITYALLGDATAFRIAQIVMDTADFNTVGVHITGGFTYKVLDPDGPGPLTETNGTAPIDMWIGAIPEPASISLLAIGAVAAFIRRRRA